MKKTDIPVVVVRDNTGDVNLNVNINVNKEASSVPASVVITLVVCVTIIVLAVAYFCPDKFAEIVSLVCSYLSKHIGG